MSIELKTNTNLILGSNPGEEENRSFLITPENAREIALDISIGIDIRIKAIETCYIHREEEAIELIKKIGGMYVFSGSSVLQEYLIRICAAAISNILKADVIVSLLSFEEWYIEANGETDKQETDLYNMEVKKRNYQRNIRSYECLNTFCKNMTDLPTPCKLDLIYALMESSDFEDQARLYFQTIVNDLTIDCEYRYKAILCLEKRFGSNGKVSYERWKINNRELALKQSMEIFSNQLGNMTVYRILAGQYLLQKLKSHLTESEINHIQSLLLDIANDTDLDINLRADAADTLLSLGSEPVVRLATAIIEELGRTTIVPRTIYDNAQNVHTQEVSESIEESISKLLDYPIKTDESGTDQIDFVFVMSKILGLLEEERKTYISTAQKSVSTETDCVYCHRPCSKQFELSSKKQLFVCGSICEKKYIRDDKIRISLNRIDLDRVLYSKYNQTMSAILIRIWSYIVQNTHYDKLVCRLLEELEEMSGTCSSGIASRLINVISGYDDFNIRISWEDQIAGNLAGRLNAKIRAITTIPPDINNPWIKDLVITYLSKLPAPITIDEYLRSESTEPRIDIQTIIEEYQSTILSEITVVSSDHTHRLNFLKFFRENLPSILTELELEFKPHLSREQFDLAIRKALIKYEN
jgi:uncharacterized protein (UPF0147 family)